MASCTLATDHGTNYVSELLKGLSLKDGIDEHIQIVHLHYRGRAVNAVVAALKDLYLQYQQIAAN